MTVNDIYELSLAPLFEEIGEDEDYKSLFPRLLTLSVRECFKYENQIRASQGRELLKSTPLYKTVDNTIIDMDDDITILALPYAIASHYYADDNKKDKAIEYRNRFIDVLQSITPAVERPIVSVWGGGCD